MNTSVPADTRPLVAYIVSSDLVKYSSLLPSNPKRSYLVHTLVKDLGLLSQDYSSTRRVQVVRPRIASFKDLEEYHSKEYLEFVLGGRDGGSEDENFGLEDDCPAFPGLAEYIKAVAGATLTAVNALKAAEVAICWDGGRHHAQKTRASGFCYVADCVLAILLLKRFPPMTPPNSVEPQVLNAEDPENIRSGNDARKARVMYLDLDVHFSDGVSHAFYQPTAISAIGSSQSFKRQVLTLSVHHTSPGFFPVSNLSGLPPHYGDLSNKPFDPYTLAIPLDRGLSSRTYLAVWPTIECIKDAFDPDYIVVQCGADGLAGDPGSSKAIETQGVGNWSLGGEGSLGWCVDRILKMWRGKKLLLGGGGYHSTNVARAWAYLTSIALDNPLPLETGIPLSHDAFPLYGPSFTLDVPAGNMIDHNAMVDDMKERFKWVCQVLEMDRLHI